ncbi:MAG: tRNA pseudouridine(38-40) synthase TruA [Aerococcus sp.]|nr:tRNA pseudouridine(38-40) synthase TruA [Aerococcus sp.]
MVEVTQRFKVTVAYDGTPYAGFQIQPKLKTVQGEIENALTKMSKGYTIPIIASGRTDSGVHALGQVIHFDYPSDIAARSMQKALNSLLPESIRITHCEKVSADFHARYDVKSKRYRYRVNFGEVVMPFDRQYILHHPYHTDVARILQALPVIIGTHDFSSFCSTKTDKTDKVRTITEASFDYEPATQIGEFHFTGDGFLYNMVRILVGTSLQIGDGIRPIDNLQYLLDVKDRTKAGPTAPAHGLFLEQVRYLSPKERQIKNDYYAKND